MWLVCGHLSYFLATDVTPPTQIKLSISIPTIHSVHMEQLQISSMPILILEFFLLALQHIDSTSFILTKISISIKVPYK
jgi:hypothetical protein